MPVQPRRSPEVETPPQGCERAGSRAVVRVVQGVCAAAERDAARAPQVSRVLPQLRASRLRHVAMRKSVVTNILLVPREIITRELESSSSLAIPTVSPGITQAATREVFHSRAIPIPAEDGIPICGLPLQKLPTSAAFSKYQAPRPDGVSDAYTHLTTGVKSWASRAHDLSSHYTCVLAPQSRERPPERPNRQRHQAERILALAPGVST